jgi:hypothetical protein
MTYDTSQLTSFWTIRFSAKEESIMPAARQEKIPNESTQRRIAIFSNITQVIIAISSTLIVVQIWIAKDAIQQNKDILRQNTEILQQDHDWNRRHYAAEIMKNWNEDVGKHKDAVLKAFPDFLDKTKRKPILREKAIEIYEATEKDKELFELRNHMVAMFNHLEYIASVYRNGVADRPMIKDAFDGVIKLWYNYFKTFIDISEERVGFRPWEPINNLIIDWEAQQQPAPRNYTGQ